MREVLSSELQYGYSIIQLAQVNAVAYMHTPGLSSVTSLWVPMHLPC